MDPYLPPVLPSPQTPAQTQKALRYYVVMFLEVYDSGELETGGPLNAGKTAHGNH